MQKAGLPVLLLSLALLAARPQGKKSSETYTEPIAAGPDANVMGEYAGEKLGAQIIGEGGGRFTVFFLPGGLPGAGWDGSTRISCTAVTTAGKTVITGPWTAELLNGELVGKEEKGAIIRLRKTPRVSPSYGARAPADAIVLFDGSGTEEWTNGVIGDGSCLKVGGGTKDAVSKKLFKDFKLHLEFRLPWMPKAKGQARANSGIYIQSRYELQVLDSFGLQAKNNDCGGFYLQTEPKVNMCYPPLTWQTYDIEFTAARFDDKGQRTEAARATVEHNGVKIHDNLELKGKTGSGESEKATPGPIKLQDHGNPVLYRNIWIVETK